MRILKPKDIERMNDIRFWHRIPIGYEADGTTIIYTPGEVNHGPNGGTWPRDRFGIPDDLAGKSVLDVGAWDGFFSFYCEEHGAAHVVAMDVPEENGGHWGGATTGFDFAKKMLGSKVEFQTGDIQSRNLPLVVDGGDNTLNTFRSFDFVLCYGVLYHIDNPLIAIENLAGLTASGGTCLIETAIEEHGAFLNMASWNLHANHVGDPTNKWYPTRMGLQETCMRAGFASCKIISDIGSRVTVRCTKG